ncbi:MAG: hypothetical protein WCC97_17855 [Candidatus Acidiferrales bacterium]
MKKTTFGVGFLLIAIPVFAQQSTTNTDCNVNGQQVNCTSTTTTQAPPSGGAVAGVNKALAANRERADANRALRAQQAQQAKAQAELKLAQENRSVVNIVYCKQNAAGSVSLGDGHVKPCTDELAYSKTECTVNPSIDFCKLFMSHADMEKAFADLAEEFKYDPRAKKHDCQMYYDSLFQAQTRWACLSFPETKWPLRDGTSHPCPNAPAESAGAVSETKQ